jgi:hypothetical protein
MIPKEGIHLARVRWAPLVFLAVTAGAPARGAPIACPGCLPLESLTAIERDLVEDFRRALAADGRNLCVYDDRDAANAHSHADRSPPTIHLGHRYLKALIAGTEGDSSLGARMDRFYEVGVTVFHEYGHTLMAEIAARDPLVRTIFTGYDRSRRDGMVAENYADCISGVILGGLMKTTRATCGIDQDCAELIRRALETALSHAFLAGARVSRSRHGSRQSRVRMVNFGIGSADPRERREPRSASPRCLAEAVAVADEELRGLGPR